jgi:hypothetical protein
VKGDTKKLIKNQDTINTHIDRQNKVSNTEARIHLNILGSNKFLKDKNAIFKIKFFVSVIVGLLMVIV